MQVVDENLAARAAALCTCDHEAKHLPVVICGVARRQIPPLQLVRERCAVGPLLSNADAAAVILCTLCS